MALSALVYISQATCPIDRAMLQEIGHVAALRNASRRITGVLLYSNTYFIQALEGDPHKLMLLFDRIRRDKRHRDLQIIHAEEIERRLFASWHMGVLDLSHDPPLDLMQLIRRLASSPALAAEEDAGRQAIELLKTFRHLLPGRSAA